LAPYDAAGFDKPISLLADPQNIRAWPGGSGDMKFGGNYGRTVPAQVILKIYMENARSKESTCHNAFPKLSD